MFLLAAAPAFANPFKAAADGVLAAHRAGRDLKELAARARPDPWDVVSELCSRGEHEAAEAFAKAGRRPDTEALPAYVDAVRADPVDPALQRTLDAVLDAFARRDLAGTWAAVKDVRPGGRATVPAIRILRSQGYGLRATGRLEDAAARYGEAARRAASIGWLATAADSLYQVSVCHERRSDFRAVAAVREERLAIERKRGAPLDLGKSLMNLALAVHMRGDNRRALRLGEEALAHLERAGSEPDLARANVNLSLIYGELAYHQRAVDAAQRALAWFERAGDASGVAAASANLGSAWTGLGRFAEAQACFERALQVGRGANSPAGVTRTLISLSRLHEKRGDFEQARAHAVQAHAQAERMRLPLEAAMAVSATAALDFRSGAYAQALRRWEEAVRRFARIGADGAVAEARAGLALVHMALGDHARALPLAEAMLETARASGRVEAERIALNNLVTLYLGVGEPDRALACAERVLRLAEETNDEGTVAGSLLALAVTRRQRGELDAAQRDLERALPLARKLGLRYHEALVLAQLGAVRIDRGRYDEAEPFVAQGLALARDIGELRQELLALGWLAAIRFNLGRAKEGLELAREGAGKLSRLSSGLGDEQGAAARDRVAAILETGLVIAAGMRDPAEALFFIESARAATLLEALGNRDALVTAALPDALVKRERAAREALEDARARLRVAVGARKRKEIRDARAGVTSAEDAFREVVERVQREAKASADLVYPVPATLAETRACLREDEAIVFYAFVPRNAFAVVVTPAGARVVRLDPAAAHPAPDDPSRPWDAAPQRAALLAPLRLKTKGRVLVVPHGPAARAPFAALAPGRDVAFLPSAATYRLLRSQDARGAGVLALGAPDYEGRGLAALPASRVEAEAVGDVALLGGDATEAGLAATLRKAGRWRAVHFACHGLVDPRRPMLSSLALTAGDGGDGLLTVLEILRARVPADLVVLSACETAKGKAYRAEGILGFTRAFMLAGASRVVVSLWSVDDEATRALMVKFYELWKRGKLATATALRQAQAHVAAREKWKHPYYWAAWQLWGLPD